jgi:hypothetical protein
MATKKYGVCVALVVYHPWKQSSVSFSLSTVHITLHDSQLFLSLHLWSCHTEHMGKFEHTFSIKMNLSTLKKHHYYFFVCFFADPQVSGHVITTTFCRGALSSKCIEDEVARCLV